MSFPSPKGATVLEYEYCTSNATRRSGMENEYMKVAYDIIHIYALVLIIASSMHKYSRFRKCRKHHYCMHTLVRILLVVLASR